MPSTTPILLYDIYALIDSVFGQLQCGDAALNEGDGERIAGCAFSLHRGRKIEYADLDIQPAVGVGHKCQSYFECVA